MPSNPRIINLMLWALLTLFIVLALLGALTVMNFNTINTGTCKGVGGKLVETENQVICVIDK